MNNPRPPPVYEAIMYVVVGGELEGLGGMV